MFWHDIIRKRIAFNVGKLSHLSDEQKAQLIESETNKAIGATEAGEPLNVVKEESIPGPDGYSLETES